MGYIGLFVDSAGPDGQRVNIGLHHVAHGGVDHLMASHTCDVLESIGHDITVKVPEPVTRTGVTRMQVRLILDPELDRVEGVTQRLLDSLQPFHVRAEPAGRA